MFIFILFQSPFQFIINLLKYNYNSSIKSITIIRKLSGNIYFQWEFSIANFILAKFVLQSIHVPPLFNLDTIKIRLQFCIIYYLQLTFTRNSYSKIHCIVFRLSVPITSPQHNSISKFLNQYFQK